MLPNSAIISRSVALSFRKWTRQPSGRWVSRVSRFHRGRALVQTCFTLVTAATRCRQWPPLAQHQAIASGTDSSNSARARLCS
jgi:hypothetical protein